MLGTLKNFLVVFLISFISISINSEENPYVFIDANAQKMVKIQMTEDFNLL